MLVFFYLAFVCAHDTKRNCLLLIVGIFILVNVCTPGTTSAEAELVEQKCNAAPDTKFRQFNN